MRFSRTEARQTKPPMATQWEEPLDPHKLARAHLSPEKVTLHRSRLRKAMLQGSGTNIPVEEACNFVNRGLLSWENTCAFVLQERETRSLLQLPSSPGTSPGTLWQPLPPEKTPAKRTVGCILAAGAASRHLGEIDRFVRDVEDAFPGLATMASAFFAMRSPGHEEGLRAISSLKPQLSVKVSVPDKLAQFARLLPVTRDYNHKEEAQSLFQMALHSVVGLQAGIESMLEIYCLSKTFLRRYAGVPKALLATTSEGDSFLELKFAESRRLFPCAGHILIAPAGQSPIFKAHLERFALRLSSTEKTQPWAVLEQGPELCTLRFKESGEPIADEHGSYCPVPAGHGELLSLFPRVHELFPHADCLHLRNIDNVIGTLPERQEDMTVLGSFFFKTRENLEVLRARVWEHCHLQPAVARSERVFDEHFFAALLELSRLAPDANTECLRECVSDEGRFLGVLPYTVWTVLQTLFHWHEPADKVPELLWLELDAVLAKPLSVMGVVRRKDSDVGGGPVFVRLSSGQRVKICLEMSHTGAQDFNRFFGESGQVRHINPVLIFFELRTHSRVSGRKPRTVDFASLFDHSLWLLTRRQYLGEPVVYHETVMSELLGNSSHTNVLFVEIPRHLFVPHKTVFECAAKDREGYGFSSTDFQAEF